MAIKTMVKAMNVEILKQMKKDSGYTNQMISDESGVPLGTVQKIFSGESTFTPNPKQQQKENFADKPESGIQ